MLMMAFANYDTPGVQRKARIIAETFNNNGGMSQQEMEQLSQEIAKHPDFEGRTKITLRDGELKIVFSGSAVFPEGAYVLDSNTVSMVDTLIEMIKSRGPDYRILVEGHADKSESLIAGNMNHWSLSAARAANVAARFEYFGFKSEYMAAVAKGDGEPVSEYKTSLKKGAVPSHEVAKLNRRAVIRVLEPIGDKKSKVRVGALFRDAEGTEETSDKGLFRGEDDQ
jgi:chemotaxis protein MotB